jgi:hypothetical protein
MKGAAITAVALLGLAIIVPVRGETTASAAEIAAITWDESNVATLRSANVADVEKLVCGSEPPCWANVDQFEWTDLEGNGKYSLVCVWDARGKVQTISIFQRAASGKIAQQSIDLEGYAHEENLADAIRDLNGDGKKELIVNSGFGQGPDMADTPLTQWPMVYRWQDGHYVEASREFPGFYDKEVLSPLEEKISTLQKKLDSESEAVASEEAVMKEYHWIQPDINKHTSPGQAEAVQDLEHLALLQRLRDHILLVLGRGLTPEQVKEAREWLKSPDYMILDDARWNFEEMGGHEAEVRQAQQAQSRMFKDAHNASAQERKVSPVPPPVDPEN